MKGLSVLLLLLLLTLSVPIYAQGENEPKVTVPDAVMKEVVKRVVTWYFKPRTTPAKIYFVDDRIAPEWFPDIKNVEFVLLPQTERLYYFFGPIERKGRSFDINFGRFTGCRDEGYGRCCFTTGDTWRFNVIGKRVCLYRAVIGWAGTGCGSA